MSDHPWYRRFPDNFLGGVLGLTLEEKGAYSVVLDMIYGRGGPIKDEPRYIAGVCNCSVRKWNAVRARLIDLGKLYVIDGCLMNARAGEELERTARLAREASENGAKGGDKTAEKRASIKKDKGLGAAGVQPSRASPLPNALSNADANSNPTEGFVAVDESSSDFKAVLAYRTSQGKGLIVGSNFKALVPPAELKQARAAYGDMGGVAA